MPRSSPPRPGAHRIAFAAILGLAFAASASFASEETLAAATLHLQPGWQDDARPLLYDGERPGGSAWHAPESLPRGTYRVIERDAQGLPHLVPRQRFQVKGVAGERVIVFITSPVRSPEALDERYLGADPTRPGSTH